MSFSASNSNRTNTEESFELMIDLEDLEAPLLTESEKKRDVVPVKPLESLKEKEDAAEDDVTVVVVDTESTVIDARCNLLNGTYLVGFIIGLILQACSLYAVSMINGEVNGGASAGDDTGASALNLGFPVVFALYFFSRYWVLVALLLPPVVCAMSRKFSRSRRTKDDRNSKKKKNNATASGLEAYLEVIRFQFGLFFGSLILLSIVNFYALAKTAPLCMLLAYYGVCVTISFFALCLLQLFVDQVCASISSIEIIVSYDNDDEDDHDNDTVALVD